MFMETKHGYSYRAPAQASAPVAAPAKSAPRPVTAEEEAQVVALFNGGMSKNAIANLVGRSPRTIGRILERATREDAPQMALRLLDGGAS
jgi:DNA invertase Pin-like site-specific DNA recombinase